MRSHFPTLVAACVATALSCSCGGTKDTASAVDPPLTTKAPTEKHQPVPAPSDVKHLLMVSQSTGHLVVAEIRADKTILGDEIDGGGEIQRSGGQDHVPVFAAADETSWLYVRHNSEGQTSKWQVIRHHYGDASSFQEFSLDHEKITALHLEQNHLFIGAGPIVGAVDMNAKLPTFSTIWDRSAHPYKAYDLFARDGSLLVAIDDEVMPMYAELLELDSSGKHTLVSHWELPGLINGHYTTAVLHMDDPDTKSGTLYLTANFSIMSGTGRLLTALPIKDGKLVHGAEVTLNSSYNEHAQPPIVQEFLSRGNPNANPRLLAGKAPTEWNGIAKVIVSKKLASLAIAAGKRGLLTLPADFSASNKATEIVVGGICHDIVSIGEQLFALVESDGKGWLVELSSEDLSVITRTVLPRVYHRLVK